MKTIQASEKTASSAKQRSNILEKDLKDAKNKIDGFVTNLGKLVNLIKYWDWTFSTSVHFLDKKSRDIEDLQTKLNVCESEQKKRLERKTEEVMQ